MAKADERVIPEVLKAISEADFQDMISDLAHLCGYKVAHFRKARKKDGSWITPVSADGKGWPDLILCNDKRKSVIVTEIKSEQGKVTPEQQDWIDRLSQCGIETHVWKPSQWDEIVLKLRGY